jgi:hypothetical protein
MGNRHLPKPRFFFKGFPEDVRFRKHTVPESLEIAKGTMYEAWFNALRLSPYMAESIDTGEWLSDQQHATYEKFGDLRKTTFDQWWVDVGFNLFAEMQDFKRLTLRKQCVETEHDTLLIEIPLTTSPATLKAQFSDLLREHHPYFKKFDRWEMSTANAKLQSSRLTSLSINLYLMVYEKQRDMIATNGHEVTLYQVGEALDINPRLVVKHADRPADIKEKHLQMSLQVSEYLKKAKNLIAYASEGVFPYTEDHDWVERVSRAPSERFRIGD